MRFKLGVAFLMALGAAVPGVSVPQLVEAAEGEKSSREYTAEFPLRLDYDGNPIYLSDDGASTRRLLPDGSVEVAFGSPVGFYDGGAVIVDHETASAYWWPYRTDADDATRYALPESPSGHGCRAGPVLFPSVEGRTTPISANGQHMLALCETTDSGSKRFLVSRAGDTLVARAAFPAPPVTSERVAALLGILDDGTLVAAAYVEGATDDFNVYSSGVKIQHIRPDGQRLTIANRPGQVVDGNAPNWPTVVLRDGRASWSKDDPDSGGLISTSSDDRQRTLLNPHTGAVIRASVPVVRPSELGLSSDPADATVSTYELTWVGSDGRSAVWCGEAYDYARNRRLGFCVVGDYLAGPREVLTEHAAPQRAVIAPSGRWFTTTVEASGTGQRLVVRRFADAVWPRGRRCLGVSGPTNGAALVNLTPVLATGAGDGQLVSSDVSDPPVASNVNFRPGVVDPNVAVASIGADGEVCFVNSVHSSVHLVADHLGTIGESAYTPATASGAPDRRVDTRINQGGGKIGPSGRRCFSVSGNPGDAALVNLTPVLAEGPGDGQLVSSDVASPPVASNVNFRPGLVDPNVAIAKIGTDGRVCFVNSVHGSVHLVADHLGTIAESAYTPAKASGAPDRRVDTRIGQGGGKIGPSGRRCFAVSGNPGDAAIVNLTPVLADGAGDGQLVSSDVANPPVASNVNFRPGSVDPNVAIAKIGADGKVCFVNSVHTSVHLVADHLGTISAAAYTPATASGAPDRRVDTRK